MAARVQPGYPGFTPSITPVHPPKSSGVDGSCSSYRQLVCLAWPASDQNCNRPGGMGSVSESSRVADRLIHRNWGKVPGREFSSPHRSRFQPGRGGVLLGRTAGGHVIPPYTPPAVATGATPATNHHMDLRPYPLGVDVASADGSCNTCRSG